MELEERYVPDWVVLRAVGKAIGESGNIRGVEGRSGCFAVLVEDGENDE